MNLEEIEKRILKLKKEIIETPKKLKAPVALPVLEKRIALAIKPLQDELDILTTQRQFIIDKGKDSPSGLIIQAGGNIYNSGEIQAQKEQIVSLQARGDIKQNGRIKFADSHISTKSAADLPWWLKYISFPVFTALVAGYLIYILGW